MRTLTRPGTPPILPGAVGLQEFHGDLQPGAEPRGSKLADLFGLQPHRLRVRRLGALSALASAQRGKLTRVTPASELTVGTFPHTQADSVGPGQILGQHPAEQRPRRANAPILPAVLFTMSDAAHGECGGVVPAHVQLNLSQASFFIKRWCSSASVNYANAGIDDNQYKANNIQYAVLWVAASRRLRPLTTLRNWLLRRWAGRVWCRFTNVVSVTCDPNALCSGATCVCGTNYYGTGLACQRTRTRARHRAGAVLMPWLAFLIWLLRLSWTSGVVGAPPAVTCTGNTAPGYYFDASTVTLAGQNATTTTCAPGLVGSATRLCVWNGPTSASGVWANPINNCQRTCDPGFCANPCRTRN